MIRNPVIDALAILALVIGAASAIVCQRDISEEANAFARDCAARGGQVRMEFNMRQCVGAREQKGQSNGN